MKGLGLPWLIVLICSSLAQRQSYIPPSAFGTKTGHPLIGNNGINGIITSNAGTGVGSGVTIEIEFEDDSNERNGNGQINGAVINGIPLQNGNGQKNGAVIKIPLQNGNGHKNGAVINGIPLQNGNGDANGQVNGAVIGTSLQNGNGQKNGAVTGTPLQNGNGHANGHKNGAVINGIPLQNGNGDANGQMNGAVIGTSLQNGNGQKNGAVTGTPLQNGNGHANGHKNGAVINGIPLQNGNGDANGQMNGAVIGTSLQNGNGQKNGAVTGTPLQNGNGHANGHKNGAVIDGIPLQNGNGDANGQINGAVIGTPLQNGNGQKNGAVIGTPLQNGNEQKNGAVIGTPLQNGNGHANGHKNGAVIDGIPLQNGNGDANENQNGAVIKGTPLKNGNGQVLDGGNTFSKISETTDGQGNIILSGSTNTKIEGAQVNGNIINGQMVPVIETSKHITEKNPLTGMQLSNNIALGTGDGTNQPISNIADKELKKGTMNNINGNLESQDINENTSENKKQTINVQDPSLTTNENLDNFQTDNNLIQVEHVNGKTGDGNGEQQIDGEEIQDPRDFEGVQELIQNTLGSLEALAVAIAGGGFPGKDYPILSRIPDTGFKCDESISPGYYADVSPESRCQVFHICQKDGRLDSFLCPNGTLFNQRYYVCDWWYHVDCEASVQLFNVVDDSERNGESAENKNETSLTTQPKDESEIKLQTGVTGQDTNGDKQSKTQPNINGNLSSTSQLTGGLIDDGAENADSETSTFGEVFGLVTSTDSPIMTIDQTNDEKQSFQSIPETGGMTLTPDKTNFSDNQTDDLTLLVSDMITLHEGEIGANTGGTFIEQDQYNDYDYINTITSGDEQMNEASRNDTSIDTATLTEMDMSADDYDEIDSFEDMLFDLGPLDPTGQLTEVTISSSEIKPGGLSTSTSVSKDQAEALKNGENGSKVQAQGNGITQTNVQHQNDKNSLSNKPSQNGNAGILGTIQSQNGEGTILGKEPQNEGESISEMPSQTDTKNMLNIFQVQTGNGKISETGQTQNEDGYSYSAPQVIFATEYGQSINGNENTNRKPNGYNNANLDRNYNGNGIQIKTNQPTGELNINGNSRNEYSNGKRRNINKKGNMALSENKHRNQKANPTDIPLQTRKTNGNGRTVNGKNGNRQGISQIKNKMRNGNLRNFKNPKGKANGNRARIEYRQTAASRTGGNLPRNVRVNKNGVPVNSYGVPEDAVTRRKSFSG